MQLTLPSLEVERWVTEQSEPSGPLFYIMYSFIHVIQDIVQILCSSFIIKCDSEILLCLCVLELN